MQINWQTLEDYPTGIQESAITLLNDKIISIGGFCSGILDPNLPWTRQLYMKKKHKYPRGFKKDVYTYDLKNNKGWEKITSFPGLGRQGHRCVTVNDTIYVWGGFSYVPQEITTAKLDKTKWGQKKNMKTYCDGYKLKMNQNGEYEWTKLPDLPDPITGFILVHHNNYIYMITGSSVLSEGLSQPIVEINSCSIGNILYRIDINNISLGWEKATNLKFPGTLRMNASGTVYKDELYVIGGIYPESNWSYKHCEKDIERYYTVLDNWKYNFQEDKWYKLDDNQFFNGNFGSNQHNKYKNYLILFGGAYFSKSISNGKKIKSINNRYIFKNNYNRYFLDSVVIYNLETNKFEDTDLKLFAKINIPIYVINDNIIYLLGGESTNFKFNNVIYGCHNDIFVKGTLCIKNK